VRQLDYIESENTETYPLKAKVFGSILVSAGQERRRTVTWNSLFNRLSAGRAAGVINVVAWGCHSVSGLSEYKEHKIYKDWKAVHPERELSVREFTRLFQNEMLLEELEALKFLEPHLKSAKGESG
jgi:hypothetical protein